MLTLDPGVTEQELAAELDGVIKSRAERVNSDEPTFGQRIVNLVLSPNYEAWMEADKMRWTASITGVRGRQKGYYRSQEVAGEKVIHMTENQSEKAWQILEREGLVGLKAQERILRARKVDALHVHLEDWDLAELIVDSLEETAQKMNGGGVPAAYLHCVKMQMKYAHHYCEETIQQVNELLELLVAFNADFRA